MKYIKISLGIFLVLASSRLIPHPPNFTSLMALSFYVPVLLGLRYIPSLLIAFVLTDFIIGYHSGTHWTWGSVLIIGLISQYFSKNISLRFVGALTGAFIFFLITNFGVWLIGYPKTIEGFISCYIAAIPFFGWTIAGDLFYSYTSKLSLNFFKGKLFSIPSN